MSDNAVLVVDDEKNIRLAIPRALEPMGLPVETAVNGEEALARLADRPFTLVFLGLKLSGIDGIEVLRRIRDAWPDTRVIVVTAYATVDSAVTAMKLGAIDYVQKPLIPSEIRELAAGVLAVETRQEASPPDYLSLTESAKRYISDRRFATARQTALRAVAADPLRPEAYNLLGVLFEITGDPPAAIKLYQAALAMDCAFKPARDNLQRTASETARGQTDRKPSETSAGDPRQARREG